MHRRTLIHTTCVCLLFFGSFMPVLVRSEELESTNIMETNQDFLLSSTSQADSLNTLEGIEKSVESKVPTGLGLWWREIKERATIAITFDTIKKDELRLKYAEERMRLAELIAEKSDKPKVQAKAQKMVEHSQQLMLKIEEHKETFLNNPDERVKRLLQNIGTFQTNREQVMDKLETKLEGKLSEEQMNKLRELRQRGLEDGQRLLNALDNEKIPEQVREHLQQVKDRIEEHAQAVREYQEQRKELLGAVKNGDEGAKEQLQQLKDDRKQKMEETRGDFSQEVRPNTSTHQILQKVGDEKVQPKTKVLEKVQNVRDAVRQRVEDAQSDRGVQ